MIDMVYLQTLLGYYVDDENKVEALWCPGVGNIGPVLWMTTPLPQGKRSKNWTTNHR